MKTTILLSLLRLKEERRIRRQPTLGRFTTRQVPTGRDLEVCRDLKRGNSEQTVVATPIGFSDLKNST
jgi:hypothetical protein